MHFSNTLDTTHRRFADLLLEKTYISVLNDDKCLNERSIYLYYQFVRNVRYNRVTSFIKWGSNSGTRNNVKPA